VVSRSTSAFSREELLDVLESVMDPEVPVLSVVELGIVRDVDIRDDAVIVTVTPTYSGCPALRAIEQDIEAALLAYGVERVQVQTSYSPAWTTDWIPAEAREKLRAYGIAPPGAADHDAPVSIGRRRLAVRCPFCGSMETVLRSEFGSTACKATHVCQSCSQPFEEFKAI
jgi:ring-1,2-phenylacetyl-CoA epoxidase subunit PaaD